MSSNDIENQLLKDARKDKIINALNVLFSINTAPDKIIAFVFNRIIATTDSFRKNGSPKEIAEKYGGIKIETMFEIMKKELEDLVSFEIPSTVYQQLEEKIDETTQHGNEQILFMLTPRGITDSSNWITKKIKEKEEEE